MRNVYARISHMWSHTLEKGWIWNEKMNFAVRFLSTKKKILSLLKSGAHKKSENKICVSKITLKNCSLIIDVQFNNGIYFKRVGWVRESLLKKKNWILHASHENERVRESHILKSVEKKIIFNFQFEQQFSLHFWNACTVKKRENSLKPLQKLK